LALRNHALHPQPDVALAFFLLVPPDEMGAALAAWRLFKRLDPQPLAIEIRHRKIWPPATSSAAELARSFSSFVMRASRSFVEIARRCTSITLAICNAAEGAISPLAIPVRMADVARRQSCVEWMDGSSKATGLCWPTGERRFMQMRMAATLPSSASWAARLAMFSASPSSRFCTMLVARLRDPGGRPAGFPLWPLRNLGILLIPLLVWVLGVRGGGGQKRFRLGSPGIGAPRSQGVFGVPRLRAMKNPARFPGPGLGTLLKDIFLYLSPVSTSRSQKLQVTSCTEITSCTMHRLYSASQ